MVISVISGGFANQLFKYACAYSVARKYNQELVILTYTENVRTDPFQLDLLKVKYDKKYVLSEYCQVFLLMEEWSKSMNIQIVVQQNFHQIINEQIFQNCDAIWLFGDYQKDYYYQDYLLEIKEMFEWRGKSEFLEEFKKEVADKNSVGIHIRRGDFMYYDGLYSDMEYYKAAMVYMDETMQDNPPHYYVISDDKDYPKEVLGGNQRIHYVNNLGDYDASVEEFFALKMCKHRILTRGSSFGKMANILNEESNSTTLCQEDGERNPAILYLETENIIKLGSFYDHFFSKSRSEKIPKDAVPSATLTEISHSSIDSYWWDAKIACQLLKEKIRLLLQSGLPNEAEYACRKLWQWCDDDDTQMHELFCDSLRKSGHILESLLEIAACGSKLSTKIGAYHEAEEKQLLETFTNIESKKFLFFPSKAIHNCFFEEMLKTGMLLRRLGHDVCFIYKEETADMINSITYNKILNSSNYYEDVIGRKSKCRLFSRSEIEKEGSIEQFVYEQLDATKETIVVAREGMIFEELHMFNQDMMKKIYWDETNMMDSGNFIDIQEMSYVRREMSTDEKNLCYKISDYYITYAQKDVEKTEKEIMFQKSSEEFGTPFTEQHEFCKYFYVEDRMIKNVAVLLDAINEKNKKG